MKKLIIFVMMLLFALPTFAAGIEPYSIDTERFSWLPNDPSDGTIGYKIHWGLESYEYTTVVDVGEGEAYVDDAGVARRRAVVENLPPDVVLYFAATAYNADGSSSPYSNEVLTRKYTQAPPPPVKITGFQIEPEPAVAGAQ